MKFSAAAVFAFATGALAYPGNVTVVTEVVESFVTYCPSPTTITYGSSTITVTAVSNPRGGRARPVLSGRRVAILTSIY